MSTSLHLSSQLHLFQSCLLGDALLQHSGGKYSSTGNSNALTVLWGFPKEGVVHRGIVGLGQYVTAWLLLCLCQNSSCVHSLQSHYWCGYGARACISGLVFILTSLFLLNPPNSFQLVKIFITVPKGSD